MQLMGTYSPRDYFVAAQDGLRLHVQPVDLRLKRGGSRRLG
jgi:hypothetical protein